MWSWGAAAEGLLPFFLSSTLALPANCNPSLILPLTTGLCLGLGLVVGLGLGLWLALAFFRFR